MGGRWGGSPARQASRTRQRRSAKGIPQGRRAAQPQSKLIRLNELNRRKKLFAACEHVRLLQRSAEGRSASFPTCCIAVLPACEMCEFFCAPVFSKPGRLEIEEVSVNAIVMFSFP